MKIAYLISHGHTARGALQTGLLKKLGRLGEVHVVAKPDAVESLQNQLGQDVKAIHGYDYTLSSSDQHLSVFRMHVHQNIKKNPALWEKHLWRTRSKSNTWKRRLLNYLFFYAGALIRVVPGGKSLFYRIEAKGYYKPDAVRILSSIEADLLISTRPVDEMEICMLEAARRLGIHRSFYILSWDNITSKGVFPVSGDTYLTWGPIMNKELSEYYKVPESKTYNTGVTHFDIHAQVREGDLLQVNLLDQMGLDSKKPYLFFTMSASYYAPNEIDIVEWLAKAVEDNRFGNEMQLVIRPHMANLMADRSDQSWLTRLNKLPSKRVTLDVPDSDNSLLTWYMKQDDMIKLSNLIHGSSICLNSGSTISIEAAYLNRPIILTSFDISDFPKWQSARRLLEYLHLKKFISFGGCAVVQDLKSLEKAINRYLEEPSLHEVNRLEAVEMECFKNDGKATDRFVKNVSEILNGLK